jgi:hypothetical protein
MGSINKLMEQKLGTKTMAKGMLGAAQKSPEEKLSLIEITFHKVIEKRENLIKFN